MQAALRNGIPGYIADMKEGQTNAVCYSTGNLVHSIGTYHEKVGTSLLECSAGLSKYVSGIIPSTLMLSLLNLVKVQTIEDYAS